MPQLSDQMRNMLERSIIKAREVAEEAASMALIALAVMQNEPFHSLDNEQRHLRRILRAKARQLGDGQVAKGFHLLVEEIAYEQWHCRLFARFLAENSLLMHPSGIAVTLEECSELAVEEKTDMWQLAMRYAGNMLPGIFRTNDFAMQVTFSPEGRHKLENIIAELPTALFITDDALGWVYQFWQTKKKKEVNESGRKIGDGDISVVTQLFTEHYMVRYLLENSLGAWWATHHPQSPLIKGFLYLRFKDNETPASGTFSEWPARVAEVTVMDPCCGSGHFLVAAFEMLRKMRIEEEGLSPIQAADAVLRDNLFGLELDPRCTQIAAFALALAAWKTGGYRLLPPFNIACSGIPVTGQRETWTRLAGDDMRLSSTLERYYQLFEKAPHLGSLINPNDAPLQERLFNADYAQVEPLLAQALAKERNQKDPVSAVFGIAAESVAKAIKLLAGTYTLVVTNVPYLKSGRQVEILKHFCKEHYPDANADLATTFIQRCKEFTISGGSYAVVAPQNWLSQNYYKNMRMHMLKEQTWNHISRLGTRAFETISGEIVNVGLLIFTNQRPQAEQFITGIDISNLKTTPQDKAVLLSKSSVLTVSQSSQLRNPDARISLGQSIPGTLLNYYARGIHGLTTGDLSRMHRYFWEFPEIRRQWIKLQSTVTKTQAYGGRSGLLLWNNGNGPLRDLLGARIDGREAWGKQGIAVSQVGSLPCTLYTGEAFDNNTAVILPTDPASLPAIWAFCQSSQFNEAVRQIDQALKVTNATLVKVPFNLEYWQKVAEAAGPLPEPYSNDPTQWLFDGEPLSSTQPLHVAVARLLGYRWPQQRSDNLDTSVEINSIICLPPVAGEATAVERLRLLLAVFYRDTWSPALQDHLLKNVGFGGRSLEVWLRDSFFEQHCRLFHNRPFIWHIWDGRKDGFSALVNYHKLDAACLDRLIYTYLGPWIAAQKAESNLGVAGAEARFIAASKLHKKLEAIRDGEPPYDIYTRWKSLQDQPIGWNPDLNDGVRVNIRPFVQAGVLRCRFNIHWKPDRGVNPDGSERHNDVHYTTAQKYKARKVPIL